MGRYILPSFEEKTPYGVRTQDPYTRLYHDRVIFVGTAVDDVSANDIMAQLLVLQALDATSDITMYINSPGGFVEDMTGVYDTIQHITPKVRTVCLGQAGATAAILLGAGAKGLRAALPNARILLHQPQSNGGRGQASDIDIQATELSRSRDWVVETLIRHTGQEEERIRKDLDRDFFLTAPQALEYGLIDEILMPRNV